MKATWEKENEQKKLTVRQQKKERREKLLNDLKEKVSVVVSFVGGGVFSSFPFTFLLFLFFFFFFFFPLQARIEKAKLKAKKLKKAKEGEKKVSFSVK